MKNSVTNFIYHLVNKISFGKNGKQLDVILKDIEKTRSQRIRYQKILENKDTDGILNFYNNHESIFNYYKNKIKKLEDLENELFEEYKRTEYIINNERR